MSNNVPLLPWKLVGLTDSIKLSLVLTIVDTYMSSGIAKYFDDLHLKCLINVLISGYGAALLRWIGLLRASAYQTEYRNQQGEKRNNQRYSKPNPCLLKFGQYR